MAVAVSPSFLSPGDDRAMIPIGEAATKLGVSKKTLIRNHLADPGNYPADKVGRHWRVPCWWVELKLACGSAP